MAYTPTTTLATWGAQQPATEWQATGYAKGKLKGQGKPPKGFGKGKDYDKGKGKDNDKGKGKPNAKGGKQRPPGSWASRDGNGTSYCWQYARGNCPDPTCAMTHQCPVLDDNGLPCDAAHIASHFH